MSTKVIRLLLPFFDSAQRVAPQQVESGTPKRTLDVCLEGPEALSEATP